MARHPRLHLDRAALPDHRVADITAATFVGGTEELQGRFAFNPGGAVAAASTTYLLLAIVMGLVQRRFDPPLWLVTILRDFGLGVAGAALAGALFGAVSTPDASVINVFGLVVTLAGASAALVVYHMKYPHVRAG